MWTLIHKHVRNNVVTTFVLAEFKLAVLSQSAKLNSPPIFHAILYINVLYKK